MAVSLGYTNVYRDPLGYPEWFARGLPVETVQAPPSGLTGPTASDRGPLHGWALLWALMGVFAGGIALNLTPCVYPLIPVTVSYFGGQSDRRKGRLLVHGSAYVAGLALTNSVLGVFAAMTGGLMGAALQHPAAQAVIAAIMLVLAASLFGFWEIRLPAGLGRAAGKTLSGYPGSLFMGMTMGLVAAPCIGPFVLGLLTWVADVGSIRFGFTVFFILSLGLGLPLFILALFSGHIHRLPRSGQWMTWIRLLMGWVLVAMAAYYARPLLGHTAATFVLAAIAAAAGIHLGWMAETGSRKRIFVWIRAAVGSAALVAAVCLVGLFILRGPGVDWHAYSEELLESARMKDKPVILDFYADWCSPCVALDQQTFHDPRIVALSKTDVFMVKVDLTRRENAVHEELLRIHDVKGVPTVIFLDPDGREIPSLRLTDFMPAEPFLERMVRARGNKGNIH